MGTYFGEHIQESIGAASCLLFTQSNKYRPLHQSVDSTMPPSEAILNADDPHLEGSDVVEMPLLLLGWQMSALERAAHHRGLTAAEMVRQVLRDFIADRSVAY